MSVPRIQLSAASVIDQNLDIVIWLHLTARKSTTFLAMCSLKSGDCFIEREGKNYLVGNWQTAPWK